MPFKGHKINVKILCNQNYFKSLFLFAPPNFPEIIVKELLSSSHKPRKEKEKNGNKTLKF